MSKKRKYEKDYSELTFILQYKVIDFLIQSALYSQNKSFGYTRNKSDLYNQNKDLNC